MRTDMSDLIPFHRTREANKRYACDRCGVRHVKLWRPAHVVEFWCAACLQEEHGPRLIGKDGRSYDDLGCHTDQLFGFVPAVPCQMGWEFTTWNYTSVPADGVRWWKALPLRLTPELLLVDTETTGLEYQRHEVISVAWLPVDPGGLPIGKTEQLLFLPERDPEPEVAALNGYSREKWLAAGAAPITPQALYPLAEAAEGRSWGGSNPAFDWEMLKQNGKLPFHLQCHHLVDVPSMYWGYVLSGVIPDIRQRTLTKHFLGREQKHEADADLADVAELYRLKITGAT